MTEEDPRTCPACHCTRVTEYTSRNAATGAPTNPMYLCVTPFCDRFMGLTADA
jgi:hypothetical protein